MDEETDSPFAHVPVAGAGPAPLQADPVTWESQLSAVGRLRVVGPARWPARIIGIIAIAAVVGVPLSLLLWHWFD